MGNKGSITIFMTMFISIILILVLVLSDISEYYFEYNHFIRENYLIVQNQMKRYDNSLFDNYGILGFRSENELRCYENSLNGNTVLKESITKLMRYRVINDASINAIEKINEGNIMLGILKELDETIALKNSINRQIKVLKIPSENSILLLSKKVLKNYMYFEYPYSSFDEILNIDFATGELIKLEINEYIKEIKIDYFDMFDFDNVENLLSKPLVIEYVIDYLGYSSNINKKEIYTSEFVLTGFTNTYTQRSFIEGEIFSLRVLLNTACLIKNAKKMKNYSMMAGGDVRGQFFLMLVDSIIISLNDANEIYEGNPVPLIKNNDDMNKNKFKSGLYYKDYIRVLLYFIPENILIDRIENSIERVMRIDLENYYTYLSFDKSFNYSFQTFDYAINKKRKFEGDYNE
ncbi:MAG: DUF5702 domain-containing protein [Bacillota bacterium]|nr:DUF5702 domain-containing protein [Bacillota bacterium]